MNDVSPTTDAKAWQDEVACSVVTVIKTDYWHTHVLPWPSRENDASPSGDNTDIARVWEVRPSRMLGKTRPLDVFQIHVACCCLQEVFRHVPSADEIYNDISTMNR